MGFGSAGGFWRKQGGAAFQPSDIPDISLWLDTIDSTTVINTVDGVDQWDDKGGLSNDLIQPTASRRPSYNTTYLDFDGNNDSLYKDSGVFGFGLTEGTFFAIFNTDTTATQMIHTVGVAGSTPYGYIPIFYIAGGNLNFGIRTSAGVLITVSSSISTGVTYLARGVWDGDNIELFIDQISVGTNSGANMDLVSGFKNIAIGRRSNIELNFYNGKIMSILDYSRALNTTEIGQVETYLIDRYGLTL